MPGAAATDVFEQLRPRLVALSLRIVGSAAEAEDVVQDCFLKWQAADRAALATPAAWLTTVVRRQSIDRLRRRARETLAAQAAMELAPAAPPSLPDDRLLRRADVGAALARLLARLSPSERLALVLFDVFECGH
ncbi:MAG: sigma factor, partial [Massilia sp.]